MDVQKLSTKISQNSQSIKYLQDLKVNPKIHSAISKHLKQKRRSLDKKHHSIITTGKKDNQITQQLEKNKDLWQNFLVMLTNFLTQISEVNNNAGKYF